MPATVAVLVTSGESYLAVVEAGTYHDVHGVVVGFNTAQLSLRAFP